MSITSLGFLLFLLFGSILFYIVPSSFRWKWMIILSFLFVFSSSMLGAIFILATSISIYCTGIRIEDKPAHSKAYLISSISFCIGILFVLKYFPAIEQLNYFSIWTRYGEQVRRYIQKYIFPIGISYYTLQAISYILDVYWGRIKAERSYAKILLFTCYFPQLVQGPISKYGEIAPELFEEHRFDWKNIKFGTQLMLWGYFKKLVIADRIGIYVNNIFYGEQLPTGINAWIGLVFYGIQLYCDFSGGIDVIRGVSNCYGIEMKQNFNQPFFSRSLGEFWRRWHISLGQWMKDYIFYPVSISKPLGKTKKLLKKKLSRKIVNRIGLAIADIVVFVLVGIWHGMGTNYLAWGLYNGFILAGSAILVDLYAKGRKCLHVKENSKLWNAFMLARTFLIVTIGWIFDCTGTAKQAAKLFVNLFKMEQLDKVHIGMNEIDMINLMVACIVLIVVSVIHEKGVSIRVALNQKNYWLQVLIWTILIQWTACLGRIATAGGFMYANF